MMLGDSQDSQDDKILPEHASTFNPRVKSFEGGELEINVRVIHLIMKLQ